MKKIFLIILFSVFIFGCDSNVQTQPVASIEDQKEDIHTVYYPIYNFDTGVTSKPFGIYITPNTSPIQPEKFTGYHTGVDIEIPDDFQNVDVPVYSISDGVVKLARTASGYGGVMAIVYEIEDSSYVAVYGHLRFSSFSVSVGDKVAAGQKIAVLGNGFSKETDGERKHLHFAVKPGSDVDLRGYVSNKTDLDEWVDPVAFLER